jgi:hypothetical protein
MAFDGGCLCGAVRYASFGPALFMGNCYCADCRRESGTGHITAVAVPDPTLSITGDTADFTKKSDSGQTIRNTFCPVCATTVCTHPSGLPGLALIRAGTLDDPTAVAPQINMYVACAPAWDRPPEGLASFPGMAPAGPG